MVGTSKDSGARSRVSLRQCQLLGVVAKDGSHQTDWPFLFVMSRGGGPSAVVERWRAEGQSASGLSFPLLARPWNLLMAPMVEVTPSRRLVPILRPPAAPLGPASVVVGGAGMRKRGAARTAPSAPGTAAPRRRAGCYDLGHPTMVSLPAGAKVVDEGNPSPGGFY